jgi:hypothetical protein
MNVVDLDAMIQRGAFRKTDCQDEDPVGQAIASLTSAAERLYQLAIVSEHRERMANQTDFEIVRHAMLQVELVASLIDVRMTANEECA